MKKGRIELHPAWVWDCERCGRENFSRGIVPHLTPEEEAELRDENGIEQWVPGDWTEAPKEVACAYCWAEFDAFDMDDGWVSEF